MRHTEPVQAPNAPSTAHPQHVEDHDRANAPDPQRKSWSILALDLVAQVLVVLDISVVNSALPTIGADLQFRSGICSGSSPRTYSCPAAGCSSAGGSRTCSPGDAFC